MAPSLPASAVLRSVATRKYLSYVGGVANAEETSGRRDKRTSITTTTDIEDKYNFIYILSTFYSYILKIFTQWWRPPPTVIQPTSVNQERKSSSASLGYVSVHEKNIFNPMAKIAVEKSKTNSNYVHLRFPHANKYLVRRGSCDKLIVASPGQPDEDRSKLSCTLFEPVAESNGTFSLRHVQSGLPVCAGIIERYVFLGETETETEARSFTFVDWETLVKLPKHVAFKGYNDRYLQAVIRDRYYHYLESSSNDRNNQNTAFEITTNPDGSVRIWSLHFGQFWRRSPNWIWADSTDETGADIDTLFWPVKLTKDTIALRNAGNNRFCKPLTTEGKTNCLNAADATISNLSYLKVEELVLERNIFNVRYHMDDARIDDDEMPTVAGFGSATNTSAQPASLTIKVAYEDMTSSTFSNTVSIMTGVRTDIKAGVPLISEGKIEVSAEVTNSLEWNRTATKARAAEALYEVVVPPRSSARVTFVATRGTCSVPFSYTQRDKLSRDGSFVTSHHVDGVYTGVNYYIFRFEKHEITPL